MLLLEPSPVAPLLYQEGGSSNESNLTVAMEGVCFSKLTEIKFKSHWAGEVFVFLYVEVTEHVNVEL